MTEWAELLPLEESAGWRKCNSHFWHERPRMKGGKTRAGTYAETQQVVSLVGGQFGHSRVSDLYIFDVKLMCSLKVLE